MYVGVRNLATKSQVQVYDKNKKSQEMIITMAEVILIKRGGTCRSRLVGHTLRKPRQC